MAEAETVEDTQNQKRPAEDIEPEKKRPKKFKKSVLNPQEPVENEAADGEENGSMPKPVQSKRQKKKLKKIQNSEKNKSKEIEKTIEYLRKWKEDRDQWKYEKLRQIFVQKYVLDETVISEEYSELAITYLATSQGAARTNIVQKAEEAIKKIEAKVTDENTEELTSSAQYKRARAILQLMQE